ncbi:MAG: hypothetical protein M0R17_02890 [Candidatus Omnitrophica bacterium]|nr:hypothetical protein [Candidatus Omnitrophota bacterium]
MSNSSSSNFVVIAKEYNKTINLRNDIQTNFYYPDCSGRTITIDSNFGHNEFGWENTTYHAWTDKIMWSYMQALYAKRHDLVKMLSDLIKEKTKCKCIILHSDDDGTKIIDGYIDHQSIGDLSIFKDKETLNNFIFNEKSYIQGGNDNE